jgi:hypothetical protein
MATLSLWATHFPERQPKHYVFPAERYGAAGDQFCAKAYDVDPTKAHRQHQGSMGSCEAESGEDSERHPGRNEVGGKDSTVGLPLSRRFRDQKEILVQWSDYQITARAPA